MQYTSQRKLYTSSKWFTKYALKLGRLEVAKRKGLHITLFESNGLFNVRAYNYNKRKHVLWRKFKSLAEARRYYRKQIKRIGINRSA